jgi:signal-transduction protein with cAMP-binding, CBS, and nucleotidyltransferase domain
VTVLLTLDLVEDITSDDIKKESLEKVMTSENPFVRERVNAMMKRGGDGSIQREKGTETQLSITDKILYLKGIEIFEALSVGELSAIASVSEEVDSQAGDIVIRENDPGDTLYLIISGEVSVIKGMGEENEFELDRIHEGDYFGEMALFEDILRTASIRTEKASRFLVLHKQEFKEIVREYPQIALHICKILSSRIRRLHKKLET